jgi:hypothetical protein
MLKNDVLELKADVAYLDIDQPKLILRDREQMLIN